jgi:phosphopantetheinyl transferase
MPIFQSFLPKSLPKIWIWCIEETDDYFEQRLIELGFHPQKFTNPKRQSEYLASRFLLSEIFGMGFMNTMTADEFGKLINVNATDCFSLSHSYPFTAVTQWDKSIGIDLQCYTEKIETIALRFLSDREFNQMVSPIENHFNKIQELTLLWNIKEAVYKAYGKKNIIFKNQIQILKQNTIFEAKLFLEHEIKYYQIQYKKETEFSWCVAYE